MSAKFHFINHACFILEKNNSAIIFDPYLDDNPEGLTAKDIKVDYIFVSHGHFDHLGSAFEIAKNCDATIISTAEICGLAQDAGCKAHAMHLGGTFKFPFGKVRLTLAFHGSGVPGGHACGIVIDFYGTKPKLDAFEYAVLPIGGNFTMDPNDALIACKLLQAKYVIPVHYNTWPPIAQDVEAFKAAVEDETDSKVLIVKPGHTIDID